jgi:hypothetical protein
MMTTHEDSDSRCAGQQCHSSNRRSGLYLSICSVNHAKVLMKRLRIVERHMILALLKDILHLPRTCHVTSRCTGTRGAPYRPHYRACVRTAPARHRSQRSGKARRACPGPRAWTTSNISNAHDAPRTDHSRPCCARCSSCTQHVTRNMSKIGGKMAAGGNAHDGKGEFVVEALAL